MDEIKDQVDRMSLGNVAKGKRVRFLAAEGGRALQGRLAAMGLVPGAEIEVIQNEGSGPIILCLRGSRIALGRGMACKIQVV